LLGEFEGRLTGDAGGGGGREFLLELFEFLFGDVGFFVAGKHEAGGAGVLLEVVFGTFEFDAHVIELAGEPIGGLFGGFPARFEVLIDEFGGEGVEEGGGEAGVGGIGGDFDDAGLAGGAGFGGAGDGVEGGVSGAGGVGFGDVEELAPGGEAGGGGGVDGVGFELGDDAFHEGVGLEDTDLGGNFGRVGATAGFVDLGGLTHIHEIVV
jgi:hypothetical protein